MKISFKIIGKIFYATTVIFLVMIFIIIGLSLLNIPRGLKLYTVLSGSMKPVIHTGSLIISQPSGTYQVGDIITFTNPGHQDTTTHRIDKIEKIDDKIQYFTKGDANNAPDQKPIDQSLILGKTLFSIPVMGYPISYAKTKEGLLVLVIIPSILIIYNEIINLKNELIKKIKNGKNSR